VEEPVNARMLTLVLVGSALVASGCAKKTAPESLAPAVAEARDVAPRATETAESDSSMRRDQTPDIWSQDLDAINAWAREQGLLGEVYFDFDRYELRAEARDRLTKNAEFMREHPDVQVTIEGHCDERGTSDYNTALGDRRASTTVQFLEQLGIDRGRLRTISYGEERPQCRESTENCWSRNRRAAFMISGRGGRSTGG
jgi:peptidoglycan-associated lipoprotein